MIAVLDTSPICYLVLIGEIDLLPILFESLHILEAVSAELAHPAAPTQVRSWIEVPPAWLEARATSAPSPARLSVLQAGESAAIRLATELQADWLVADDLEARRIAQDLGLRVTGLVGLLARAAQLGRVDLASAFVRLKQTSFHVTPALLERILREHEDRQRAVG